MTWGGLPTAKGVDKSFSKGRGKVAKSPNVVGPERQVVLGSGSQKQPEVLPPCMSLNVALDL